MTTDNITTLHLLGNRPGLRSDIERLIIPLDLAEAERAAWLAFRISRRAFRKTRTLTAEIVMIEARDLWGPGLSTSRAPRGGGMTKTQLKAASSRNQDEGGGSASVVQEEGE